MKRVSAALLLVTALLVGLVLYGGHRRDEAFDRRILAGQQARAAGDLFAAIEAFSVAIALKPDAMVGYLRRGEAYLQRRELEAALRDLRHAAEIDPYAPGTYELLGDVNYAMGRYETAAERYASSLALDDDAPRVLYKQALAHFSDGQPQQSEAALTLALALDERFAEAYYLLGLSLRDLQRLPEAATALERAVALAPALFQAREALGSLYGRMGRRDDRLQELDKLRVLDPNPSREVALAMAYARSGRTDYAISALGRAMERYPDFPHAHTALARIWLEIAEARQDRVALGKALGALESAPPGPNSAEMLALHGRALLLAGEVARAERLLRQATSRRPVEPLAFLHLAEAAERLGQPAAARDALLDYHALSGDETDPRRRALFAARVAGLCAKSGDAALALAWYERAATSAPNDLALAVRYAEAQASAGDVAGARASLARVLERDPEHREARDLLRRLR